MLERAEPLTPAELAAKNEFDTTSDHCAEVVQTLLTRLEKTLTPP